MNPPPIRNPLNDHIHKTKSLPYISQRFFKCRKTQYFPLLMAKVHVVGTETGLTLAILLINSRYLPSKCFKNLHEYICNLSSRQRLFANDSLATRTNSTRCSCIQMFHLYTHAEEAYSMWHYLFYVRGKKTHTKSTSFSPLLISVSFRTPPLNVYVCVYMCVCVCVCTLKRCNPHGVALFF